VGSYGNARVFMGKEARFPKVKRPRTEAEGTQDLGAVEVCEDRGDSGAEYPCKATGHNLGECGVRRRWAFEKSGDSRSKAVEHQMPFLSGRLRRATQTAALPPVARSPSVEILCGAGGKTDLPGDRAA
jgi:hypothetical protein